MVPLQMSAISDREGHGQALGGGPCSGGELGGRGLHPCPPFWLGHVPLRGAVVPARCAASFAAHRVGGMLDRAPELSDTPHLLSVAMASRSNSPSPRGCCLQLPRATCPSSRLVRDKGTGQEAGWTTAAPLLRDSPRLLPDPGSPTPGDALRQQPAPAVEAFTGAQ